MKQLFLMVTILISTRINAITYSSAFLPDSIKKNANAVLWNYDIEITINKDLSFTEKVHKIITILNSKGDEQANYYGYESKEMTSVLIHGIVYDENGIPFKKIKKQDLNTIGENSQFISNFRADYFDPGISKFPYTVEYEYETKYEYLLYLPEFNPYQDYNTAVLNASYKINTPDNCGIRFYNLNNVWKLVKEKKEGTTVYTLEVKNQTGIQDETDAPDFDKIAPKIITAPDQISYYGYKSKFENWNDFGKWIAYLNNNRDSLPPEIKEKMQQYKIAYTNILDRAKAIYNWMQDNTRYYSIQLGLGGYQPMKTLDVNKNKYGDCKALSFYTKTLFKEAGIESYYTLVSAGKNKNIIQEIPSNQFNHVIVCLPLNKDTVWLECTDQKIAFGYLGDFTDDRDVLVINENPKLAHTKIYGINDNVKTVTANVVIDEDKNVEGKLAYVTKGLQSEALYKTDYLPSKELQQKYLYDLLDVNNLEMQDYTIQSEKTMIPQKTLSFQFNISNYITSVGSKFLFEPNIFSRYSDEIKLDSNRILPIEQEENFMEIDTVAFLLPKNYFTETKINTQVSGRFGNYSAQTEYNKSNSSILYIRKLVMYKGIFPVSDLKEYVSFIKKIISSDNSKVLLKHID